MSVPVATQPITNGIHLQILLLHGQSPLWYISMFQGHVPFDILTHSEDYTYHLMDAFTEGSYNTVSAFIIHSEHGWVPVGISIQL